MYEPSCHIASKTVLYEIRAVVLCNLTSIQRLDFKDYQFKGDHFTTKYETFSTQFLARTVLVRFAVHLYKLRSKATQEQFVDSI